MKNISHIEAGVIGAIIGGSLSAITGWGALSHWQWWVAFMLLLVPVSQAYAHIRDWIKKPRPVYQDDIQDNLGKDDE